MSETDECPKADQPGGLTTVSYEEMENIARSNRRKGRIDACRVINEMAARFPSAALQLRECVRLIERMG